MDIGWAVDRYASIKDDKVTTGVFYDQDGTEHSITSGTEEISARILVLLKCSPVTTQHQDKLSSVCMMFDGRGVISPIRAQGNAHEQCGSGIVQP